MAVFEEYVFWAYASIWVLAVFGVDAIHRKKLFNFETWRFNEHMPRVVSRSCVVGSEVELHGALFGGRMKIHGRSDQIMHSALGEVYLIDTKLRGKHQVWDEDVVQLSLYREMMVQNGWPKVHGSAFVRTVVTKGAQRSVRYHKVKTKTLGELEALFANGVAKDLASNVTRFDRSMTKGVEKTKASQNNDLNGLDFSPER